MPDLVYILALFGALCAILCAVWLVFSLLLFAVYKLGGGKKNLVSYLGQL